MVRLWLRNEPVDGKLDSDLGDACPIWHYDDTLLFTRRGAMEKTPDPSITALHQYGRKAIGSTKPELAGCFTVYVHLAFDESPGCLSVVADFNAVHLPAKSTCSVKTRQPAFHRGAALENLTFV